MNKNLIINNSIKDKIYTIRGMQVMLDSDLAELYKVKTKRLNEQTKRNQERFPKDFMFQLTEKEVKYLRSQIATTNLNWNKKRFVPYVFTQEGISMLSGVLKSNIAIEINIKIMRAFISMRTFISKNEQIFHKMDNFERKLLIHDEKLVKIFKTIEIEKPKQGIFFEGQIFDAYKFVSDLIRSANESIILIDNYVDDSVLTLFSKNKNVEIVIYTKIDKKLKLDLKKFNSQYEKISVKEFDKSHDRFLIIDSCIYHFGASLKDLGKKWFAFSKLSKDSFALLEKLR